MGLTAVQEDVQRLFRPEEGWQVFRHYCPDGKKMIPQQHDKIWLKPLFEGSCTHLSSKCPPERAAKHERKKSGSDWIIIACHNMGLGLDFEVDINVPERFAATWPCSKAADLTWGL